MMRHARRFKYEAQWMKTLQSVSKSRSGPTMRLAVLQAFVSLVTGDPEARVESLLEAVASFKAGKPLICKQCRRDLNRGDHARDCHIYRVLNDFLAALRTRPRQSFDVEAVTK